jgi:hypothetical protein
VILEFEPFNKSCASLVTPPKSAKHYLPEWYKRIKTVYNINEYDDELSCPLNNSPELNKVLTAKTCVPTLESFTIGYIQETWIDIEVIQDTKARTLKPLVKKYVEKGTTLVSDEWLGYHGLSSIYNHQIVNHSKNLTQ